MDHPTQQPLVSSEVFADGPPPAKRQALEEGRQLPCATEQPVPAGKRKIARKAESIIEAGVPMHWQAVGQHMPQIIDGAIEEALTAGKPINDLFRKSTHTKLSTAWSALINGTPAVFEMNGSFKINVRRRFELSRALLGEVLGFEQLPTHVGRFVEDHPRCSFAQLRLFHETILNEGQGESTAVHEEQIGRAPPVGPPATVASPRAVDPPLNETVLENEASATAASGGGNEGESDDEVLFVGSSRALRRSRRKKVKQEPTADTEESHSAEGGGTTVKQEPDTDDDNVLDLQLSPTPPPTMDVDDGIPAAVDPAPVLEPAVTLGYAEESPEAVAPSLSAPTIAVATSLEGFLCFGVAKPCPCQSVCQSVLHSGALGDFAFIYQTDVEIRNEHGVLVKAKLYQCQGCLEARARSGFGEDLPSVFVVEGHFVHHDPNMPQGNEHRCIRDQRQQQAM